MLERRILIVDDNADVSDVYIPAYINRIHLRKKESTKWINYNFILDHITSMKEALEYLNDVHNYVDVLVVDYDFNGESTFSDGAAFVKYIREMVNRYCQIVFYTMQGISYLEKKTLIDMVNADVFRLVDKSNGVDPFADVLFEAATTRNPIVESLERFFQKYSDMLETYEYRFDGETISFEEIIHHIRMDDRIGRVFIEKLLQKGILMNIEI